MPDDLRPELLYHYTSAAGLKGILESGSLWATDANFLNDAQELRFGREEMCSALIDQAESLWPGKSKDWDSPKATRSSAIRSAVDYITGRYPWKTAEGVYVACFCTDGDLLSQWRGYGADGGYALGFDRNGLAHAAPPQTWVWSSQPDYSRRRVLQAGSVDLSLVEVQYGQAAVDAVTVDVQSKIDPGHPVNHPSAHGWAAAVQFIIPSLAKVKHPAFSEEREWRLLVVAPGERLDTEFRVGVLGLVPYVRIGIDLPSTLRQVVVGPGPYPELREAAVGQMLEAMDLDERVEVRLSEAPFRA